MSCEKCPCKDICRQLPAYCEWMAEDPPLERHVRHICQASRWHAANPRQDVLVPVPRQPSRAAAPMPVAIAGPGGSIQTIPVEESVCLTRAMNECKDRTVDTSCGCGGARCSRGKGRNGLVSHLDCFVCIRDADLRPPPAPAT